MGRPATELSAKGIAAVAATWGSPRGDAEFQVAEGFGALLGALEARATGPVLLGTPATGIVAGERGVRVAGGGHAVTAGAVVLALPPTVILPRLALPPKIARTVAPWLRSFVDGRMVKLTLGYDTPFWRYAGLSGASLVVGDLGLTSVDGTREDGSGARLIAFVGGRSAQALALLGDDDAVRRVTAALAAAFGEPVLRPNAVTVSRWVDHPWSGGGYDAAVRLGGDYRAAERLGALTGRVVFAGAEYASEFRGYVEGAIRSGESALDRVRL